MHKWTYTPLRTIVSGYTKAHGTAMIEITFVNKERGYMRNIFSGKPKQAPITENDLIFEDEPVDAKDAYNDTLNYLVSLTDDEYEKMLKCAKIYREADKKVAAVMEVKAPNGGDVIEVRVVPKPADDDFIVTDDQKGKTPNVAKTK